MNMLLEGLRVLDLSLWQPGQYASQLLADLGADVLKVEPPGGDRMRVLPDRFLNYNAHKRSIVLNLKNADDKSKLLDLVAQAQVVIEGYRPGVAQRLGVGFEQLSAINPALVYCSISGFGQSGPLADATGHDLNYQAYAGSLVSPAPGMKPLASGAMIGDQGSGLAAAFAILAAVMCAQRTGRGEHIDVSMTDLIASWVAPAGRIDIDDEATHDDLPGTSIYATADGGFVVLGIFSEDHFWRLLCQRIGLGQYAGFGMLERAARAQELKQALQEKFKAWQRDELVAQLSGDSIPIAPVLSRHEAMAHPHVRERGVITADANSERRVAHPIQYRVHPARRPGPAPALGEHGGVDFLNEK